MAAVARYLIDTSASARLSLRVVGDRIFPLMIAGLVGTCAPLDFEALWSTQSPAEYEEVRKDREAAYEYLPTDDHDWQRALDVQRTLARSSRVRSIGMPDLLVAAVAERHGVMLMHYDSDYDTISSITGQPTEWVARQGSI